MSNPYHEAIDDILGRCVLAPMGEQQIARQRIACGTMISTTSVGIKYGLDDEQIGEVLRSAAESIARDLGLDPMAPDGEFYLTVNVRMRPLVIEAVHRLGGGFE